jgi:hypothetical protein
MGFEITKDTLLKVSGVSAVAYCTFATVAPREFHKTFMSTVRVARCGSDRWLNATMAADLLPQTGQQAGWG